MVSVVNSTSSQDINGILWGWKHDQTGTVGFSFPTGTAEYGGYAAINGFEAFNDDQKNAVRTTFSMINSYITQFTVVESTAGSQLFRFAEATSIDYTDNNTLASYNALHNITTAEANPPELGFGGNPPFTPIHSQGDSWYNPSIYNTPTRGSFAMQAGIMHETGHNMGLKHGHVTQSGHGVTFPELPADHNSYEYSVMTYEQYVGDNNGGDNAPHHAMTFMINDIAAMQYMYGADFATENGNTLYQWNPTTGAFLINGVTQWTPFAAYVFQAIWDGGGSDTYQLSNFTVGVTIDLRPGGAGIVMPGLFANLGDGHFARANVYNAYLYQSNLASLIENAFGGTAGDVIQGNQVANVLYGGNGNDTVVGNEGADTLLGEANNDRLFGGDGTDGLYGGTEDDILSGGADTDVLRGENGNDVVTGGAGGDNIDGGTGNDTLWGHDEQIGDLADNISGGGGADSIIGFIGNDILYGGDDGDAIAGGFEADTIYGGGGNDVLWGHDGSGLLDSADFIDGGEGDDQITGHSGTDNLQGQGGQDRLDGGDGSDYLYGGAGNDVLIGGGATDYYFYNQAAYARDDIYGFLPGTDKLVFSTAIFANFAAVQAGLSSGPGYLVISGAQGYIFLHGIGALSAGDCIFQ